VTDHAVTLHPSLFRRLPDEKTPQNPYALLLMGTICLLGAQHLFQAKPSSLLDEGGKPQVLISPLSLILGKSFFLKDSRAAEYNIVKVTLR